MQNVPKFAELNFEQIKEELNFKKIFKMNFDFKKVNQIIHTVNFKINKFYLSFQNIFNFFLPILQIRIFDFFYGPKKLIISKINMPYEKNTNLYLE